MPQDEDTVKIGRDLPQNRSIPIVAVGSNRGFGGGDPTSLVRAAVQRVAQRFGVIRAQSRLYRTPAFPPGAGPEFVNAVFALGTDATAQSLLDGLHEVEREFGRKRLRRWEARTMDLDLISFGDEVLPDADRHRYWRDLSLEAQKLEMPEELVLPHPRLQDRAFVLIPLAEIAPDWVHPVLQKTVTELVRALPNQVIDEIRPV